jgi:hypothetical protein
MARKHDAPFSMRISSDVLAALERIAKAKKTEVQELMRRAAYAITEYAIANGDKAVPIDMAIVPLNEPSASELKVAEELYKLIKKEEKK